MAEGKLRHRFDEYLGKAEVAIYSILAAMLSVTAFATIATAGNMLWDGFRHWTIAAQTLRVLNELLIVLMLVEILHTVRISIRSHVLVTEPFLVVGLIASIRRILVLLYIQEYETTYESLDDSNFLMRPFLFRKSAKSDIVRANQWTDYLQSRTFQQSVLCADI